MDATEPHLAVEKTTVVMTFRPAPLLSSMSQHANKLACTCHHVPSTNTGPYLLAVSSVNRKWVSRRTWPTLRRRLPSSHCCWWKHVSRVLPVLANTQKACVRTSSDLSSAWHTSAFSVFAILFYFITKPCCSATVTQLFVETAS